MFPWSHAWSVRVLISFKIDRNVAKKYYKICSDHRLVNSDIAMSIIGFRMNCSQKFLGKWKEVFENERIEKRNEIKANDRNRKFIIRIERR